MLQSSVFQRLGKSLKASETEEVKAPLKLQTVVSTQPVTKKAIAAKPVKAMPGQKTSFPYREEFSPNFAVLFPQK